MRLAFILIISLFFSIGLKANFDFNQSCRKAYEEMMLFDFSKARKTLEAEKKLHPDNKIPLYIEAYIAFWKAALNENEADFEVYDDIADKVIEAIEDDPEISPYKNYLLSDMYLRGAYLKAMESSYMTGAYRFNKAYKLAMDNLEKYPDFIPNKKLVGLMNVGIGAVPEKYTWVLNVFNFEGNINKGLMELKQLLTISANKPDYYYLLSESLLLYSFTMLNFEVSKASEEELLQIYKWEIIDKNLSHNQFLVYSKSSFLRHVKKNNEAIACLQGLKPKPGAMHFYYLDFMLGESLLYKQDFSSAKYFQEYINEYKGLSYWRSACQKLAWIYLIQGDTAKYKQQIKRCIEFGGDNRDSDLQATKEAENGTIPNVSLLKSRLLFDGGYYQEAEEALKSSNKMMFSQRNKIEYIYRFARIYDEWGKEKYAISNYKRCIAAGENFPYYFAANSALHLGYIYERKGDIAMAKVLYQKCLDMDFDEYNNGITQKAKAALSRMEN